MRRTVLLGGLSLALATPAVAQLTRAEASSYTETASHADVLRFLDSLAARGAGIRRGTLGFTAQGRELPWVLAARPMVDGPGAAHRSGKPIVVVQANIHGGEVEGKDAVQMLLRDLTLGSLSSLLDSVVLLVIPIYNADGNDAFGPGETTRPGQNGPAVVGRRPNGMGLDLNRDYIKQDAPETRAAAALVNRWDPDVFMDLHTTNGSYHGYVLTWAPGLNPNRSPANAWTAERFLPEVRRRMRERHQMETFPYGNFLNQHPDSLVSGWVTYDARPRFGTNLFGIRGGVPVLSEAYSNADFRTRLQATYHFVVETLRLAVEERETIKRLVRTAWRPDSVAVRSVLGPPRMDDVIAEITEAAGQGSGGFSRRRRTGVFRTIRMPVVDHFVAARWEAMPAAYLLPPQHGHLVDALRRHGIRVERLTTSWSGAGEAFRVDSLAVAPTVFEGHRIVSVEGAWRSADLTAGAGWYLVPTAQRLGVLAAYLLEPASEDGFVTWNLLDRDLRRGQDAPIVRVRTSIAVPRTEVP